MFFIYILKSLTTGRSYIGSTDNLLRRYREHAAGQERATVARGPWEMVHWESFDTLVQARRREQFLKTGFGYTWRKKNKLM